MTQTEKILLAEPMVQKKVVDVLSLFRGSDHAFFVKVIQAAKIYEAKHSMLNFESAAAEVNGVKSE